MSYRQIAPAPPKDKSPESEGNPGPSRLPPRGRRQHVVRHACTNCQSKKQKCDAKRPTCTRCASTGAACKYSVPNENMSKMSSLKQETSDLMDRVNNLEQIMTVLETGTDEEATLLLASLRLARGAAGPSTESGAAEESKYTDPSTLPEDGEYANPSTLPDNERT